MICNGVLLSMKPGGLGTWVSAWPGAAAPGPANSFLKSLDKRDLGHGHGPFSVESAHLLLVSCQSPNSTHVTSITLPSIPEVGTSKSVGH